jgi:thiol:disulfide interchange protein DsbC
MKLATFAVAAFALSTAGAVAADADDNAIRAALGKLAPDARIERIRASAMPGLAEVVVGGGQVLYVSNDGRHVINGSLLDASSATDLTELTRAELRARAVAGLPAESLIRYEPKQPTGDRVTVFTAIDCGYCRRFHADIEAYLAAGIAVDYVLIPLGGPNTAAYTTSAGVYCAADRHDAFTAATFGQPFEPTDCGSMAFPHAVALARSLGIQSTPTILGADGRRLGGYLTPAQLRAELDARVAAR